MVDSKQVGYLYELTDSKSSYSYIGITNNPKRRYGEHLSSPSNINLRKYILQEGAEKPLLKILCIGPYAYIAELEIKLIALIKRLKNTNLLNIAEGGQTPSGVQGSDHWNSTLTEDMVVLIREIYAEGKHTGRSLAKLFNISYKNLSSIVRGCRWKEAGGPITTERLEISKVANRSKIPPEEVPLVREEALDRFIAGTLNIPEFAKELGVARQNLRLLLLGRTWGKLEGPLLKQDYWEDFGHGR